MKKLFMLGLVVVGAVCNVLPFSVKDKALVLNRASKVYTEKDPRLIGWENRQNAQLVKADLSGMNLAGANFLNANLLGVNFKGTYLVNAQFTNIVAAIPTLSKELIITRQNSVANLKDV